MDNKFTNIIDSQARFFKYFLQACLSHDMRRILNDISQKTDVYVFSGMIRNFFWGESYFRDLDIVVGNIDSVINTIKAVDSKVDFKINSFGGIKVKIQNLTIDVWGLESTWGIQQESMDLNPRSLLKTAFFNFSAIVFDYNKSKFYYDNAFINFLQNRMMDVVYKNNPNIPLCIINSCYYRGIYGFGLSFELCKWIIRNYVLLTSNAKTKYNFDKVQMLHFSKVIIPYEDIKDFILLCYRHYKIGIPIYPMLI